MQHPHSPAGRLRATETPWGRAGRSPCTQLRAAGPSAPRAIDSSPQLTQTRSSLICGSSDKSPERRDPRRGRGPRFGGRDVPSSGVVASGHRRPPACRPRVQKGKQEALCPASAHSVRQSLTPAAQDPATDAPRLRTRPLPREPGPGLPEASLFPPCTLGSGRSPRLDLQHTAPRDARAPVNTNPSLQNPLSRLPTPRSIPLGDGKCLLGDTLPAHRRPSAHGEPEGASSTQ